CLLKGVVRGNEDFRNRARGRPLEIRWHVGDGILMGRHKFSMRAATDDAHNSIAFTPALRVRAQLRDFARKFQSRNVLRSAWRRSISTGPLQEVGAIQRGTPHTYKNFIRPGLWRRNVLDFQYLGSTETSYDSSFHDFGSRTQYRRRRMFIR